MSKKYVVYTCITGGYDSLREIKFRSKDIDFICFTDNANLKSNTWIVKPLPESVVSQTDIISDVKKQRLVKLLPHKFLSDYDVSLWIDSNIELIGDLSDFFSQYDLSKKVLFTNKHPTRNCAYDEMLACLRIKKDTYENMKPQMDRYVDEGYPKHNGLAETNIVLRKHNDFKCKKLMSLWAEEILSGSHRDQLSYNYCVWKLGYGEFVDYLNEKYSNLRFSDNAFFKLSGTHVRINDYVPFSTFKNEDNAKHEIVVERKEEIVKNEKIVPRIESKTFANENSRDSNKKEETSKKKPFERFKLTLDAQKSEISIETIEPPPPEKKKEEKPVVSTVAIVLFTHNRTRVAKHCIEKLIENVKYPNIKWVLSDDRSQSGHVEELISEFKSHGIEDVVVCKTTDDRCGLGASMNNGIKAAFKYSDVVLRVEDDWILEKPLDLKKYADLISKNSNVAGIRLGMVGGGVDEGKKLFQGYKTLCGNEKSWLFVNQVYLIHKRVHDAIGWYSEDRNADTVEVDFRDRYNAYSENGNSKLFVLAPSEMKWRTFDDPSLWFIHMGKSMLGHSVYRPPKRYEWLYNDPKEIAKRKAKEEANRKYITSLMFDKLIKSIGNDSAKDDKNSKAKICVYTCIIGNYDTLKPISEQSSDIDFICFTNNPYIKAHSNGWKIRDIPEDIKGLSQIKQQRILKIFPNIYLSNYDVSLWIDAVYSIVGNIKELISKTLKNDCSIYVRKHPDRDCIYDEAIACIEAKKDDKTIIENQIRKYKNEKFPRHFGLSETNMLLRRHHDGTCRKLMSLWANELLNGSHRDQISFNYCVWKLSTKISDFKLVQNKFKNGYIEKKHMHNPSIKFYTTNFNNSELTNAMIRSILKNVSQWNYTITIIDNSDKTPFVLDDKIDKNFVQVINNTSENVIPFSNIIKNFSAVKSLNNYASLRHALTIQWILDNCESDKIVLFDSDVILKRDIDFIDSSILTAAGTEFNGSKIRFTPFLQYFNVCGILENKIKYLDINRMHGGSNPTNSKMYDTGASFYEDINAKKAKYVVFDNAKYIEHLRGGSWKSNQISKEEFLKKNEIYFS